MLKEILKIALLFTSMLSLTNVVIDFIVISNSLDSKVEVARIVSLFSFVFLFCLFLHIYITSIKK